MNQVVVKGADVVETKQGGERKRNKLAMEVRRRKTEQTQGAAVRYKWNDRDFVKLHMTHDFSTDRNVAEL